MGHCVNGTFKESKNVTLSIHCKGVCLISAGYLAAKLNLCRASLSAGADVTFFITPEEKAVVMRAVLSNHLALQHTLDDFRINASCLYKVCHYPTWLNIMVRYSKIFFFR